MNRAFYVFTNVYGLNISFKIKILLEQIKTHRLKCLNDTHFRFKVE